MNLRCVLTTQDKETKKIEEKKRRTTNNCGVFLDKQNEFRHSGGLIVAH